MPINGLQDVNYSSILVGTNAPRLIDDKVRELAEGLKKSFHEDAAHARHHAAGDLKIPRNTVAALESALTSPVAGDLRYNASTGNFEIRIASDIVYAGTLSENMPDASTVVDSAADFLNQVAAFPTAAANRETDATISINAGPHEALWEVGSASQLTLAAAYSLGIQLSGVAYIVRLKTAGSWYPISDVLTNYMDEHYRTGEHKIPIRTDGADPTGVRENQIWIDTGGGTNKLKFRDTTTKQLTQGQTFVFLDAPVAKVDGVNFLADQAWTDIDVSGNDGSDTAVIGIFQMRMTNVGSGSTEMEISMRNKDHSTLETPDVPAISFDGDENVGNRHAQVFVELDSSQVCQYKVDDKSGGGSITLDIVFVGYIK